MNTSESANQKIVLQFMEVLTSTSEGFATPILKTLDTKGGLRMWQAHIGAKASLVDVRNKTNVGDVYWYSISGLDSGKKIISEKKYPKEKNLGRENETTKLTQTILDVKGEYTNRLKKGYFFSEIIFLPESNPDILYQYKSPTLLLLRTF